jgi:pimeloyl-ACP methyl ester carboxylesterase
MWDEVVDLAFDKTVPALEVPVYLTEGRHDQNTPIPLAEAWFNQLRAPYKEWIWFEESAHSPIKNEPIRWGNTVRRIVTSEEAQRSTTL